MANLHASTTAAAALVEVDRALEFAEGHARADDVVVLAGDFNLAGEADIAALLADEALDVKR